jgi:fatty acid amide hydrolase
LRAAGEAEKLAVMRDAKALLRLTMTELATAIGEGTVSSTEVTSAYLDRIDEVQARHLPYAQTFHEGARLQATEADERRRRGERRSALDGVPISLKESLDVRGTAATLGLPSRLGHVADNDAAIVSVLRDAGAVFLGKTNVSQALLYVEARNPVYGETTNPHNARRTPGGSSGGEGAAIASGASPGGIGTDIGGSIRLPAHFSGVCGLKPTNDRWSNLGSQGAMPGQEGVRGQTGPMGRTVRDLALLMQVASSEQQARLDPRVPPLPNQPHTDVDISKLRIGFFLDDGIVRPSAALQRAVQRAVSVLRAAGATVSVYSPILVDEAIFTYLALLSADGGRTLQGKLDKADVDPALSVLWNMLKVPDAARALAGHAAMRLGERHMGQLMLALGEKRVDALWLLVKRAREIAAEVHAQWRREELDAVICPPHATPALPLGASRDFTLGGALAMRFNLINFPAGVVPVTSVHRDEEARASPRGRLEKVAARVDADSAGLPVGVQVVARPWREDVVLAVMAAIEAGVRNDDGRPTICL